MATVPYDDAWYAGLDTNHKVRVLAKLVHKITLVGRAIHNSGRNSATKLYQLRELNDAQHCLAGFLSGVLSGVPADEFELAMLDHEDPALHDVLRRAWVEAALHVEVAWAAE